MKSWLGDNGVEPYSIRNEEKFGAERFIRALKNKKIQIQIEYQKMYILIN